MWWQIDLPHESHDIKVTNNNYCITVFRAMQCTLAVKLKAVISVSHNRTPDHITDSVYGTGALWGWQLCLANKNEGNFC